MKLNMNIDASEEGEPPFSPAEVGKLERVFEEELPLLHQGIEKYGYAEISVSFLSGEEIREINKNYRGIDEPTDVLTFPLWEREDSEDGRFEPGLGSLDFNILPPGDVLLPLGDILICREEAEREHREDPAGALCLVLAHGFLHLLGWDHDTPEKEREMWERQDAIKMKLAGAVRAL